MKRTLKLMFLALFVVATSANAVMWSGYAKVAKNQADKLYSVVNNILIQQGSNPQLFIKNFDSQKSIKDLSKFTNLTKYIGSNVMYSLQHKVPFSYTPMHDKNQFKICNVLGADKIDVLKKDYAKKNFVVKAFKQSASLKINGTYDPQSDCYTVYDDSRFSAYLAKSKTIKAPSQNKVGADNCLSTIYASKSALDTKTASGSFNNLSTGTCAYVKDGSTKVDTYYFNNPEKKWYLWSGSVEGLSKDDIIALIKEYSKTTTTVVDNQYTNTVADNQYTNTVADNQYTKEYSKTTTTVVDNQCTNGLILKLTYLGQPVSTSSSTPSDGYSSSSSHTYILSGASFYSNAPTPAISLVDSESQSYDSGGECDTASYGTTGISISYNKSDKKFYFSVKYTPIHKGGNCSGYVSPQIANLNTELYKNKTVPYAVTNTGGFGNVYFQSSLKYTYDKNTKIAKICLEGDKKCYSYKVIDCQGGGQ